MDLARVDRDGIPGAGLDHAAAAQRSLGAPIDDADPELLVRMARKAVTRPRLHGVHAREGAAEHPELTLDHGSRFILAVARRPARGPAADARSAKLRV